MTLNQRHVSFSPSCLLPSPNPSRVPFKVPERGGGTHLGVALQPQPLPFFTDGEIEAQKVLVPSPTPNKGLGA